MADDLFGNSITLSNQGVPVLTKSDALNLPSKFAERQLPYADNEIVYNSYAGVDIVAQIIIPCEEQPLTLGELSTISYSMHRENTPVRFLGHTNVSGFLKGGRTIGGSMIFTVFDTYCFYRLKRYQNMANQGIYALADMLPPFDIVLSFANEYGMFSKMKILGCTITDEGGTMSVDDLQTESTYCVDDKTEILTSEGWKSVDKLKEMDQALTINPQTKAIEWNDVESIHTFDYNGEMIKWKHYRGLDALTTPTHRWLTTDHYQTSNYGFSNAKTDFRTTEELTNSTRQVMVGGGTPLQFASEKTFSNELVELIAFAVTEGHYIKAHNKGVHISQSEAVNPDMVDRLRYLVKHFKSQNATASEYLSNRKGHYSSCHDYYFGKGIGEIVRKLAPDKNLPPEFLITLTLEQALLLYETMIKCDGYSNETSTIFIQNDRQLIDDFQMLASMLGKRTSVSDHGTCKQVNIYTNKYTVVSRWKNRPETVEYSGMVWCPKTRNETWLARRNKSVFWTGNTYMARGIQPLIAYEPDGVIQYQDREYVSPNSNAIKFG